MKLVYAAMASGALFSMGLQANGDTAPESKERLSISVTNKYGDVFTNLAVAKVLSDGLVLEHKAGQLKVNYADLPQAVREKYQPMAVAAENKDEKAAAANAAYVASQRRAQSQQAKLRAARKNQETTQEPAPTGKLRIEIPEQGWGITVLSPGLRELGKQSNDAQFIYRAVGRNGFNLSVFVERPGRGGSQNRDVFNFYWAKASRNPLIDEKSVKAEMKEGFVKVSYTTLDMPNANYYFAYKDKWVDVHISKSVPTKGDEALFADFEQALSYSE
jgi:hypothetical protein